MPYIVLCSLFNCRKLFYFNQHRVLHFMRTPDNVLVLKTLLLWKKYTIKKIIILNG